jgi:predicted site-specific integrase-resolvase
MNISELLTPKEAAAFLKVSPRSMERWRNKGTGPKFSRLNGRVRYSMSDVQAWLIPEGGQ